MLSNLHTVLITCSNLLLYIKDCCIYFGKNLPEDAPSCIYLSNTCTLVIKLQRQQRDISLLSEPTDIPLLYWIDHDAIYPVMLFGTVVIDELVCVGN